MKPHDGDWSGTFVTQDGRTVQVTMTLTFKDDHSLNGSFKINGKPAHWNGPLSGDIKEGSYSPSGSIHFEEEENKPTYGWATFDGRYEVPDDHVGVIWGTALIHNGDREERGILALVYAMFKHPTAGGVWGE